MSQRRDTYEALADIRLDASGNRPISRIAEDLHEEIQALRRQAAG
jgi:shikimate kinase